MGVNNRFKILFFIVLAGFSSMNFSSQTLNAQERRIPLDLYLIIDGSTALDTAKTEAISWINGQVLDPILMDGDRVTIWDAGDRAQVIHSGVLSGAAGKEEIKNKLLAFCMKTKGNRADLTEALKQAAARVSQTAPGRLPYTMLITASAQELEPVLTGSAKNLLRWFRYERYGPYLVLVIAPDIGSKAREAALEYMYFQGTDGR